MNYIDQLISDCRLAKKSKPVQKFVMKNLSDLDGISSAVYIIKQIKGNTKKTFDDFVESKKKKNRKYPRPNVPSDVMYVGSSIRGLKTRIKQHIGKDSKGTYALNLGHWFKGVYEITVKEYDVSRTVLQIIEDNLSYKLNPAFGKRGGNCK